MRKPWILLSALFVTVSACALGNILFRIPVDIEPPLYVSNVAPFVRPDGSLFAVHNGEWAAIAFIRRVEDIPADSNLLAPDFSAFGKPMTVDGFAIFESAQDRVPIITETWGLGAVPVWFVRLDELELACADSVLTKAELEAAASLQRGTASTFQEQNHFTTHHVSHLAAVAKGTLEDGRRFSLKAVEVDLELIRAEIEFR